MDKIADIGQAIAPNKPRRKKMYQVKIIGSSNYYLNNMVVETEGELNIDGTIAVYLEGATWFVQAACLFPL